MKNSLIVTVLMVVCLISVIGALFSARNAEDFASRFVGFTAGATSGSSYINFTTAVNGAITVTGNIDFGAGYVNGSFANLSSENFTASTGWVNSSAPWSNMSNLTLRNTGNTVSNLSVMANQSVEAWIGGSADARLKFIDGEVGSCTGGLAVNYSVQANETLQPVCFSAIQGLGFNFTDRADEIAVLINVLIPANVSGGQHNIDLVFVSTANQ